MRKVFITLQFLALSFTITAQSSSLNPRLTWSNEGIMGKEIAFFVTEPIGYDKSGVFAITHPFPSSGGIVIGPGQDYGIIRIAPDLNFSNMKEINLKEGESEKTYEFALWLNNEFYVFTSFQNQKLRKTFLFAQTINKQTLEVNNDIRSIAEIDYSQFNKYKYSEFNYSLSSDSTKLLVRYSLLDKDNMILDMGMSLFSNKLENFWTVGNIAPESSEIFTFEQYAVSNKGDVFVLGRSFDSDRKYENHLKYKKVWKPPFGSYHRLEEYPNYSYKMMAITSNGTNKKDYSLSIPNKFVRKLTMKPNDKGDVICAGFFAQEDTYSVTGSCTFQINLSTEKLSVTQDEFALDFLVQDREAKAASKLSKNYKKGKEFDTEFHFTKELVLREDGGFYLIAEQVEQRREQQNNGKTIVIYNAYNYNDIVVISIDKNGNTEWKKKIDKNTYVASEGVIFSSFMVHPSNNNLYLVYEEIGKKSFNMFGMLKQSKATMVKVSRDGSVLSQKISAAEDSGVALLPNYAGYSSPNSLLFTGKNGVRKFKFLKVEL
jgi:hypothetical protein